MFDSFGSGVTDKIFRFKNFSLEEKMINKLYDPSMNGQFFQWDTNNEEKYVDDFTYTSNQCHSFLFYKENYRNYKRTDNMTVPLFHFLKFLNDCVLVSWSIECIVSCHD